MIEERERLRVCHFFGSLEYWSSIMRLTLISLCLLATAAAVARSVYADCANPTQNMCQYFYYGCADPDGECQIDFNNQPPTSYKYGNSQLVQMCQSKPCSFQYPLVPCHCDQDPGTRQVACTRTNYSDEYCMVPTYSTYQYSYGLCADVTSCGLIEA